MSSIQLIIVLVVLVPIQGRLLDVSLTKTVDNRTVHSWPLSVAPNKTVLDALNETALTDREFSFSGTHFPSLGFYLQSIGGLRESVEQNKFWFVYRLDNKGNHIPIQGLSTPITNHSHYVFHYKSMDQSIAKIRTNISKQSDNKWLSKAKNLLNWLRENIGL